MIYQQEIVGHQPGPRLLITAGVHGDEYEPIAAVRRLCAELDASQISGRVQLIPIVNGPAFHLFSRTGPDQLDLARTFPGKKDGSITERIAFEVAEQIRRADFLIDLHTGGLAARIAPLAGYMLHENEEVLIQQRAMARAFNLGIVWGTSGRLNGRTLSVARDAHVPAIYVEWGGGGGCNPQGVEDNVTGCRNVMQLLGMISQPVPESQTQYIVEDSRDESGVLQIHYLCEQSGYFEPVKQLRDQVVSGDVIGWIHSLSGEPSVPVVSKQTGVLILLRAIPAVNVGDFLAVILESNGPGEYRYE